MGTTANLDLPYPEGTDLVISGDDAMQALAEAVDAYLTPQWASCVDDDATPATPAGDVAAYDTVLTSGHFAHAAGVLTYTGAAPRWFLVPLGALLSISGPFPGSRMALVHNGFAAVNSRTDSTFHTHSISVPVLVSPGETLAAQYSQTNAGAGTGEASERYLRVASL